MDYVAISKISGQVEGFRIHLFSVLKDGKEDAEALRLLFDSAEARL